jgi:hypothetical protein
MEHHGLEHQLVELFWLPLPLPIIDIHTNYSTAVAATQKQCLTCGWCDSGDSVHK